MPDWGLRSLSIRSDLTRQGSSSRIVIANGFASLSVSAPNCHGYSYAYARSAKRWRIADPVSPATLEAINAAVHAASGGGVSGVSGGDRNGGDEKTTVVSAVTAGGGGGAHVRSSDRHAISTHQGTPSYKDPCSQDHTSHRKATISAAKESEGLTAAGVHDKYFVEPTPAWSDALSGGGVQQSAPALAAVFGIEEVANPLVTDAVAISPFAKSLWNEFPNEMAPGAANPKVQSCWVIVSKLQNCLV